MTERQKFQTRDWIIGTATTVAIGLASWSFKQDMEGKDRDSKLSERVTSIEANRFTDDDAIKIFAPHTQSVLVELRHLSATLIEVKEDNRELRKQVEELNRRIP